MLVKFWYTVNWGTQFTGDLMLKSNQSFFSGQKSNIRYIFYHITLTLQTDLSTEYYGRKTDLTKLMATYVNVYNKLFI